MPLFFGGDFKTVVIAKYDADHAPYATFKQVADAYIYYDPQAPDAWCNTLLFSVYNFDGTSLVGTPAGIGLSFFKDASDPILTFKSRYLLLGDDDFRIITQRTNAPQLTHLVDLPIGSLYLNQSANCSTGST